MVVVVVVVVVVGGREEEGEKGKKKKKKRKKRKEKKKKERLKKKKKKKKNTNIQRHNTLRGRLPSHIKMTGNKVRSTINFESNSEPVRGREKAKEKENR